MTLSCPLSIAILFTLSSVLQVAQAHGVTVCTSAVACMAVGGLSQAVGASVLKFGLNSLGFGLARE